MNDLTRRQLEMERRVYRLEDLADKELARSNAAMMAAQYLGNVLTLEWNPPPPFIWKIKTVKAQAIFTMPSLVYPEQFYYWTLQGATNPPATAFFIIERSEPEPGWVAPDKKLLYRMALNKKYSVNNAFQSTTVEWSHIDTGHRASGPITNPDGTQSIVEDQTCWPWDFNPNITQPGQNWSNIWHVTQLADPQPSDFPTGNLVGDRWPPNQPPRAPYRNVFQVDWFGMSPDNYTGINQWKIEEPFFTTGGIWPTYNATDNTITWKHGSIVTCNELGAAQAGGGLITTDALCGRLGAGDQYNTVTKRTTRFVGGVTISFKSHRIPAGSLWQGGQGTYDIPATLRLSEVAQVSDAAGNNVFRYSETDAIVRLTWT